MEQSIQVEEGEVMGGYVLDHSWYEVLVGGKKESWPQNKIGPEEILGDGRSLGDGIR